MADYGFLAQPQGVQVPDPLAVAAKGLTLSDLFTRNQAGQLALRQQQGLIDAYSDPNYASVFAQGPAGPGGAPGGLNMDAIARFAQAHPDAAPTLIKQGIDFQKDQATIAEQQAKAVEARASALEKQMKPLSNYAAAASTNPTAENFTGVLRQMQLMGVPPDFFGPIPTDGNAQSVKKYMEGVAAVLVDPENRRAYAQQAAMLPGQVEKQNLENRQLRQSIGFKPIEVGISQQNADTAAKNADTTRMQFNAPEAFTPPGTTEQYVRWKSNDGQIHQMPMSAVPGGGMVGGPVRGTLSPDQLKWAQQNTLPGERPSVTTGYDAQGKLATESMVQPPGPIPTLGKSTEEIKMLEAAGTKVADMVDTLPPIYSAINRFTNLRDQINGEKLLTGPVFGSDGIKAILGTISQLPGMPAELRKYVANTQVFDANALSGAFNVMGEGKGTLPRSTAAMDLVIAAKPGTIQYREAMLHLTNEMIADLSDRASLVNNFAKAVKEGRTPGPQDFPTSTGPGGKIPATTFDQKPDPAKFSGKRISGPDGTFRSNGTEWQLIGPPGQ